MKKIISYVAVFLSGGVVFVNLTVLKFGEPAHYDASWLKVVMYLLLALYFAWFGNKK